MFDIFKKRTQDPKHFLVDNEDEVTHLIDETEQEVEVKTPRTKRVRKLSTTRQRSKQMVVDYLSSRKGKPTQNIEMAASIGMADSYVATLLRELLATGTIKRIGKPGSYRYEVRHKRVYSKRVSNMPKTPEPTKSKMPEVKSNPTTASEKVLAFIGRHEDEPMSQDDIARGSGTTLSKISPIVRRLEKDKAIVRSLPSTDGTRYWLHGSCKTGPNCGQPKTSTKLVASSSNASLHSTIEILVWDYMRECKQTDILVFLEWLQQRK